MTRRASLYLTIYIFVYNKGEIVLIISEWFVNFWSLQWQDRANNKYNRNSEKTILPAQSRPLESALPSLKRSAGEPSTDTRGEMEWKPDSQSHVRTTSWSPRPTANLYLWPSRGITNATGFSRRTWWETLGRK